MKLKEVKSFIKNNFPLTEKIYDRVRQRGDYQSIDSVFSHIYSENLWGDPESLSGAGSNSVETEALRMALPELLDEIKALSLLDIPCGDFNWMRKTELNVKKYIGADIVLALVEKNQKDYGDHTKSFMKLDIIRDSLPQVDVIFCRDCLVHFSFRNIYSALKNCSKSKSTYLLTTTFSERQTNTDITTGLWRPLNLQAPPFNFPNPIKMINEKCSIENGEYADKSMGLWRLTDIKI